MSENEPKDNTFMVWERETNCTKSNSRPNMSEKNTTLINMKISPGTRNKVKL